MTNILQGGIAKNWKTGNLLTLKVRLEGHWPMIWDLGQNYDDKSNWQKYDDAVVRCRLFLLCGELEMRILWDSWWHAQTCGMPREIINCPLYPVGLWDTTKSLYFFLLLCSTICHGACFFSQSSMGKIRVIGLSYVLVTADISRPNCPRRQCKIFQLRGIFSNWICVILCTLCYFTHSV